MNFMDDDFYVCPNHIRTGGYETCCSCGGWTEGETDFGKECTESGSSNEQYIATSPRGGAAYKNQKEA